jgi:hypothetical protein
MARRHASPAGFEPVWGRDGGLVTEAVTDLAVLAGRFAEAARLAGVGRQPSPWLPALLQWTPSPAPTPAGERETLLPPVKYVDLTELRRSQAPDGDVIGVRLTRGLVGQAPQPGRRLLHPGDGSLRAVQVPMAAPKA